ncbi:MAG: 4'-phosphopantetheinyl transferase superfamily protein [Bacteroidota bacterium]
MWSVPPLEFELSSHSIDLYQADLQISPMTESKILKMLAPDEVVRSKKFRFIKDRRHYIAARGFLRYLVARYLGISPQSLALSYSDKGKPFVKGDANLQFNLSHAGGKALYAMTLEAPVGVDMEPIDRKVDISLIARHSFSESEQNNLFALPESEQALAFFECWTRKEAFVKAQGGGLSIPLDQFEVSIKPNQRVELVSVAWNPDEPARWTFNDIPSIEGFVGAWACGKEIVDINSYRLSEAFLK